MEDLMHRKFTPTETFAMVRIEYDDGAPNIMYLELDEEQEDREDKEVVGHRLIGRGSVWRVEALSEGVVGLGRMGAVITRCTCLSEARFRQLFLPVSRLSRDRSISFAWSIAASKPRVVLPCEGMDGQIVGLHSDSKDGNIVYFVEHWEGGRPNNWGPHGADELFWVMEEEDDE